MLVLSRRTEERICIGDQIVLTVLSVQGNRVRIGIEAPLDVSVDRQEVRQRRVVEGDRLEISLRENTLVSETRIDLQRAWSETSYQMQALRDNSDCARQAYDALEPACDPCVSMICAANPSCCDTTWDTQCVQEVRSVCGSLTTAESQGTCQHTLCSSGAALQPKCDSPPASSSCVEAICAQDSFCCSNSWDNLCVDQVTTVCNQGCL